MHRRPFLSILFISLTVVISAQPADLQSFSFGPDVSPRLVIDIPSTGADSDRLADGVAGLLKKGHPGTRITVLRSDGKKRYREIAQDQIAAVLVLIPGNGKTAEITTGVPGRVTPPWLIKSVTDVLDGSKISWNLAEWRTNLYRLGWAKANENLAFWLEEGIPAIQLATASPLGDILNDLPLRIRDNDSFESDAHYLMFRMHGRLYVANEKFLVETMIFATGIILFVIFIFSFLIGKKSDQHLRDLLHVWWLPFVFLAITIASLYASQILVAFLVRLRFGDSRAWTLIPAVAFAAKTGVAWFLFAVVISLNKLIRFPDDSFIYGYIASLVCFANVLIFASMDFSFSLLFLGVYAVAFASYHIRNPLGQAAGIIVMAVPFVPYVVALFSGETSTMAASIGPLYAGHRMWNIRLALLVMPFQLMVSRLLHTLGFFGRKERYSLSFHVFLAFFAACAACVALVAVPAWSARKPLRIEILQTIDGSGPSTKISSPVVIKDLAVVTDASLASAPGLGQTPEALIAITASSQPFLERQLVSITIRPSTEYESLELLISGDTGIPVRDASSPFDIREAGSVCAFTAGESAGQEWTVNFSSSLETTLTATVRMKSRVNPWGLTISRESIAAEYVLDAERTTTIPRPRTEGKGP